MSGIVVGVDGSAGSRRALAWALREAALHHVPVAVVAVHLPVARPATGIYWALPTYPENSASLEVEEKTVQEFVDGVASEIGEPVPAISVRVTTGSAVDELVRAARDADLLVVGSRGGGGFTGLLMGSVSSQVTHHAVCPVVVVPPKR